MTVKYNVPGAKRKELVLTIAKWLGSEVKYLGAPSFAYEVDYFHIDKNGALSFDDRADSEVIERLLEMLYDNGFESEELLNEESEKPNEISIQIPMKDFTETSLKNIFDIVDAKGKLIKKALGIEELPINLMGDRLDFPWFSTNSTPEEIKVYMQFVTSLCNLAKTQNRITATERKVENEKYAFRCFLLRLGFIGSEFKEARKILLKNLEGNSAFKTKEVE